MLINFYCASIKQSIDFNPLIGKEQRIRFYVGMFVITSLTPSNFQRKHRKGQIFLHTKHVEHDKVSQRKCYQQRCQRIGVIQLQSKVSNIRYICTVLSRDKANKVYLGTAESNFKKRYIIIGSRLTMKLAQTIPLFQNIYGN